MDQSYNKGESVNLYKEYPVAWQPSEEQIAAANITSFLQKHQLQDYHELHAKSIKEPDWFYPAVLEELDIQWFEEFKQLADTTNGIQWTNWFGEGKTNLVLNAIEKHIHNGDGSKLALIWEGENGKKVNLTYEQLNQKVCSAASGLRKLGVEKGDRVGIYLPPIPEVPITLFACAKIGAIVIPIFSGYAADAVAARLIDAQAKLLITADGSYRRGKVIELKKVADEAVQQSPSVQNVVVVQNTEHEIDWSTEKDITFNEVAIETDTPVRTEIMSANDPFMIIYTSGTTGKPKGTVHTHAGFPVKAAMDMYFCFDVKEDDRIFWLTDFGWMMGPWLFLGAVLRGATIVLYEGSPDYPKEDRLWELIQQHKITIFGVAPTVIRSLMTKGDYWVSEWDLSSLRILGSTGEAWNVEPWKWYLEKVGKDRCPIINYSGGTEVSGGILGCFPTMPLKPCAFNGPIPGMDARVVDQDATVIAETLGDLSLWNPFVGMTHSFWKDDNRYLETYWSKWENVWAHGDLAAVDKDGYWYILGRSDDTLKVAGKRIGPSEIESALASHPAIKESAAIGVPHVIKGEVPIVFVVLRPDFTDAPVLHSTLLQHAQDRLGKALKPQEIFIITELPKTQSGKVARRLLRARYLGAPLGDTSTLQNPEVLDEITPVRKQNEDEITI
jgi:acetyl-CoA synthetase